MIWLQAVGCSLFVLGLGESLAGLVGLGTSDWAQRLFASLAVLLLSIINLAGVKWVVKLQFALLLVLLLAGLDFAVGSFVHTDRSKYTSLNNYCHKTYKFLPQSAILESRRLAVV